MRTPTLLLAFTILAAGCGDNTTNNGGDGGGNHDLSMTLGDGGGGNDLSMNLNDGGSGVCSTTPMTGDQTIDCSTANCPTGQVGVNETTGCKCFYQCNPNTPTQCSCDRLCVSLTSGDAGVVGGACLPGNTAGILCGAGGNGKPCAQGLTCAGAAGGKPYCLYDCGGQTDCPAQTQCTPISNGMGTVVGMACVFISNDTNGVANGMTCAQATDHCKAGFICGTTCDQQCDGAGAAGCTAGTCKVLNDTAKAKVIAYTCQP